MTKKDFEQLAVILAYAYDRFEHPTTGMIDRNENKPRNAIDYIREEIESMCAEQNPRFDVARFRKACGVSE